MSFAFLKPALESGHSPRWQEAPVREVVGARVEKSRATGKKKGRPGKFTADQVRELRAEYRLRKSLRTNRQMAKDHGVSLSMMEELLSGRGYKWVSDR